MPAPKTTSPYKLQITGDVAEILLYSDIGYWGITAESFIQNARMLGSMKKKVRINCYGGEVFDGFAIHNEMKADSANWTTEIDAVAASIASIIALGAGTVKMRANAMIMIHNPTVMVLGDAKDLTKQAEVLNKLKDNAIDIYAARMKGWSKEDISALMDEETWYTAKEALDVGLIDEIIDPIDVEEPVTNSTVRLPTNLGKKVFVNYKPSGELPVADKGEKVMKCPSCGKEHADGAVFCMSCGKPMDATKAQKLAHDQEVAEHVAAETSRVTNIFAVCKQHGLDDKFAQELIDSKQPYDACATKILAKIAVPDPVKPTQGSSVSILKDSRDKFVEHAVNCLSVVSGIERDQKKISEMRKDSPISGLQGLCRMVLARAGVDSSFMDAATVASRALALGTGSSDLPAALEATANKSLQQGFAEAPTTYQIIAGSRQVPDFKTNSIVGVSNFGDLRDLPEGAAFEDSTISDKKETFSIGTKGRKMTVTRNAIINDDLDVITTAQRKVGYAVQRAINKGFYDKLCYDTLVGPVMNEDSVALFNDTSHFNLVANSGVVSVSSLSVARKRHSEMPLMKPEKDSNVQYANLPIKFLLSGTANQTAIEQVLGSGMDISKSIVGVYNPFTMGTIRPVFDPYLQTLLTNASKANAWYTFASQMDCETIGVALLRGNTSPTLQTEQSSVGDPLGVAMHLFFDWGYYIADYRGVVQHDGASGG